MEKRDFHTKEGGMSFVEVLLAMFFVYLAFSGLLLVIGAASQSTMTAQNQSRATVIATQRIEELRSWDFDDIGFLSPIGTEPAGRLPRQETTTIGESQYTIDYTVSWVDIPETSSEDQDYKYVRVTVTWTTPTRGAVSAVGYLSHAGRRAPGFIPIPPAPTIESPSPAPDSTVAGNVYLDIACDGRSGGFFFSSLQLRIGGGVDGRSDTYAPPVDYARLSGTSPGVFVWDTTLFEDGKYQVEAIVFEARGGSNSRTWYYYVNNHEPTTAPTLAVDEIGATYAWLSWNYVKDGNETIQQYEIERTVPTPPAFTQVVNDPFDPTVQYGESTVRKRLTLSPWTYYTFQVRGVSHGNKTPASNGVSFWTKIRLQQTSEVKVKNKGKNYYQIGLAWTAPPASGLVSNYQVWRDGALYAVVTTTSYTDFGGTAWGVPEGETHSYEIRAMNSSGSEVNRSNTLVVRADGSM